MSAEHKTKTASESPSKSGVETRTPRSFGERVRLCRDLAGIGQQVLANKVGVSLTTIQNYEGGQYPKGELAVALASALGCTLDWLLAGVGPIFDPSRAKVEEFTCGSPCGEPLSKVVVDVDLVQVPKVRARLSAGSGSFEVNGEVERYYAFRSDWLRRKGNVSSMVMMTVSGESMQPLIMDGDTVLIDQSQVEPLPGRLYAVGVEGLVYVKRIETRPGQLILKSENQSYEPIIVDTREDMSSVARILGRMIWLCRDVK